jgi:hypothetical protein
MSSDPNGNAITESNAALTQAAETPRGSTERDEESIRGRAYEICLERGGEPGHDLDDWLQAERELKVL